MAIPFTHIIESIDKLVLYNLFKIAGHKIQFYWSLVMMCAILNFMNILYKLKINQVTIQKQIINFKFEFDNYRSNRLI